MISVPHTRVTIIMLMVISVQEVCCNNVNVDISSRTVVVTVLIGNMSSISLCGNVNG